MRDHPDAFEPITKMQEMPRRHFTRAVMRDRVYSDGPGSPYERRVAAPEEILSPVGIDVNREIAIVCASDFQKMRTTFDSGVRAHSGVSLTSYAFCVPTHHKRLSQITEAVDIGSNTLSDTISVWQPHSNCPLSHEDARQIIDNVSGFFNLLRAWELKTAHPSR